LKSCLHGIFAIQLDGSADVLNVSQLMVFMGWAFTASLEDAILFCGPLLTTTRSTDIVQKLDECDLKWESVCSVCTDEAPATIGARSGFATRVKDLVLDATSVHGMIHRQALASRKLPSDM